MNCHPSRDAPLQGDDSHRHFQNVKRGEDGNRARMTRYRRDSRGCSNDGAKGSCFAKALPWSRTRLCPLDAGCIVFVYAWSAENTSMIDVRGRLQQGKKRATNQPKKTSSAAIRIRPTHRGADLRAQ